MLLLSGKPCSAWACAQVVELKVRYCTIFRNRFKRQLIFKFVPSLYIQPRKERNVNCSLQLKFIMNVIRTHFDGNTEIGAFAKLTNSYCLVGIGGSANFYSDFQAQLGKNLVCYRTIPCRNYFYDVTLSETDRDYHFTFLTPKL